MSEGEHLPDAASAAAELVSGLERSGVEYALGGALALGYWGEPRGTLDIDVTLFIPPEQTAACLDALRSAGCQADEQTAAASLREHGFCRVRFRGLRVDVFVPIVPFYESARARRRKVRLGDRWVMVWGPETLVVFKMMFFRRKDVADVEQVLRIQGDALDRGWVRGQLVEMYGLRDPRISQWDELAGGG